MRHGPRWLAAAIIGLLMLAVLAAMGISVAGPHLGFGAVGWLARPWARFTVERTLTLPDGGTLHIQNRTGSIEIVGGGPPGQVHLDATLELPGGDWSQADAEALIETDSSGTGARVAVVQDDRVGRRPWWPFNVFRAQLRLRVPDGLVLQANNATGAITAQGLDARAELTTSTGSIRIEGFQGGLNAGTSTGSIRVSGFQGELTAGTSTGSVWIAGFTGSRLEAGTGTGSVEVEGATLSGPLSLSTSTGSVRFNGRPGPNSQFKTSTGSVRLTLPPDLAYRLTLPGAHGKFSSDLPYTGGQIGTGDPVGDITIQVGTGGISIHKAQGM